jgi:hypothetical protein
VSKTIEELMSIKIIPEILDEIRACKTEDEVKQVLWKNQSPALKLMFQYVFRPEGATDDFTIKELPAFKPDVGPVGISPSSLFYEMRRFYTLLDSKKIPLEKKRNILIQILESVHPSEAKVVGQILKHDLEIPLLTEKLVRETLFPPKR